MPLTDWIWSISGHESVLLSIDGSFCIRLTVLDLHTLAKCPIFLHLLHCARRAGQICSNDHNLAVTVWQFFLPHFGYFSFPCWMCVVCDLFCAWWAFQLEFSEFFVCLFVSVFAVIIVLFDGFKDHLKIQWSFYEFVLGLFVVNSCCELVSDKFFRCNAVEFAFSLNIHQYFLIFI